MFKGEAVPFVVGCPNYRLPGLKNVAQLLWEKARDFLQKAFTVIFAATIVIWFLQNFDLQLLPSGASGRRGTCSEKNDLNALRFALRIISGKNIFEFWVSGKSVDFPETLFYGRGRNGKRQLPRLLPLGGAVAQRLRGY